MVLEPGNPNALDSRDTTAVIFEGLANFDVTVLEQSMVLKEIVSKIR